MAVSGKLGVQSKLYYNSGSYGSPTWVVIDTVSDLSVSFGLDKLDASTRASRAKAYLPGQIDLGVTFKVRKNRSDAATLVLLNAVVAVTLLDFMVLDGGSTTNGSSGFRFESYVYSAKEDQNLNAVLFPELEIAPAPTDNGPPASVVVSAGAPVFTSLSA